jgi:hypothetical protein
MFALLLLLGPPDLARLGADDWHTREAEELRCSNFFRALLLPASHPDPEVNFRVKRIRAKQLRWLDPEYVERVTYRDDFRAWVKLYLVTGRTRIHPEDLFHDIHKQNWKSDAIFGVMPNIETRAGVNYNGWLRGDIMEGEYEIWLRFLDYHLHRAPMPREVLDK